jgi:hypothetical protein
VIPSLTYADKAARSLGPRASQLVKVGCNCRQASRHFPSKSFCHSYPRRYHAWARVAATADLVLHTKAVRSPSTIELVSYTISRLCEFHGLCGCVGQAATTVSCLGACSGYLTFTAGMITQLFPLLSQVSSRTPFQIIASKRVMTLWTVLVTLCRGRQMW